VRAAPAPGSFGPAYEALATKRQSYDTLKKAVDGVNLKVGKVLAKPVGGGGGVADACALTPSCPRAQGDAALEKERADAIAHLAEVLKANAHGGSAEEAKEVEQILQLGRSEQLDKDSHVKLQDMSRKCTQRIFQVQKKLLEEMKAAKAAYAKRE
jgi:hypothetical protein